MTSNRRIVVLAIRLPVLLLLVDASSIDGDGWCGGGAPAYDYHTLPDDPLAASLALALAAAGDIADGVMRGCVNPVSVNFNGDAVLDDGSCIAIVTGCTDPRAINYVSAALSPTAIHPPALSPGRPDGILKLAFRTRRQTNQAMTVSTQSTLARAVRLAQGATTPALLRWTLHGVCAAHQMAMRARLTAPRQQRR